MKKKALITGVRGQDGSYLSELLLKNDYIVYGLSRYHSHPNNKNITNALGNPDFVLLEGDIADYSSISTIIEKYKPDEIYNLAAQSHVGASFKQPDATFLANTTGVINLLQAIHKFSPTSRFYQASTSELFGKAYDVNPDGKKYQDENTNFMPQSPYAVSKLAAHHLVRIYREAYGIYACAGILFNHECIKYDYPIIYKFKNIIYIDAIQDIAIKFANFDNTTDNKSGTLVDHLYVWDQTGWTKVKYISWFKNKDKQLNYINSRNSIYSISNDHVCILEDNTETKDIKVGDKIKLIPYPEANSIEEITLEEAELLGMIIGDGTLSNSEQFTNSNKDIRDRFEYLWSLVTGGYCKYYPSISEFSNKIVGRLDLYGGTEFVKKYKTEIYSLCTDIFQHKYKKIPAIILNSSIDIMEAFLIGYNACDGLKKNKCQYNFKNFKTNSPILASGLLFLISKVTGQKYNITIEESYKYNKQQLYYSINLLSDRTNSTNKYVIVKDLLNKKISQREICRRTGISRTFIRKVVNGYIPSNTHHLELPNNEVKKIINVPKYDNWFFDLETESGTLHAGIGQGVIHNSPRRGETFVTRKITKWIAEFYNNWYKQCDSQLHDFSDLNFLLKRSPTGIYCGDGRITGQFPKLRLGNLDAYRDWGHARDYVEAMYLMLQQKEPQDFVIATEKTHSVRDFVEKAFNLIGIKNYMDYIVIDPEFYRPAEVDFLAGIAFEARSVLNWEPKISFDSLVEDMVWSDINEETQKNKGCCKKKNFAK